MSTLMNLKMFSLKQPADISSIELCIFHLFSITLGQETKLIFVLLLLDLATIFMFMKYSERNSCLNFFLYAFQQFFFFLGI